MAVGHIPLQSEEGIPILFTVITHRFACLSCVICWGENYSKKLQHFPE